MSPKLSMWLNILMAVTGYLVGAGSLLTTLFGSGLAQIVIAVAGLTTGILASINGAFHATASAQAGPMFKYFKKGR